MHRSLVVTLLVAASLTACGGSSGVDPSESPRIVVTTNILGDIVAGIVGDDAEVEVLMPPGADPHDFEPSARQAAALRDADLVVVNGLGLEASLAASLEAAVADGATVIDVGELVDPVPFADPDDGHDHDGGHDDDDGHGHGDLDPHYWHDPLRVADAVSGIAGALAAAAPTLDADELAPRADELAEDLRAVHDEIIEILAVVPAERRYLLTTHESLGYFADRYGFALIGAVIPGGDTMASPSPAALAALVEEVEEHRLPAIFAETIVATTLADTIASEVDGDLEVVALHTGSLGPAGSGAETYRGLLLTNARLIADALGP